MEIINLHFVRVFFGKKGRQRSGHCAYCFSCLFTNKMSLHQIVSMECLSPLVSSPVLMLW